MYHPRAYHWIPEGVTADGLFFKDVDASDVRFDVNKDVVDGLLVDEAESSPEEDAGKTVDAEQADVNPDDATVAKDVE